MASNETRRPAIAEAMIRIVGRKGYREATVADAIAEAGVSRTTFYKHFADKHECFLAAFDHAAELILDAATGACDGEQARWVERVEDGLESVVALLSSNPDLARTAVVEAVAAGAGARQRQWEVVGRLAALLEAGRERGAAELPANTGLMATSAVAGLLFDEIQAGRAAELGRCSPDLLFALLFPYLGPEEAIERMGRAAAYAAASR